MRRAHKGFTLVEVAFSLAIFAAVTAVAFAAMVAGNRSFDLGVTQGQVDDAAARLLHEIVEDLRQSGPRDPDLSLAPGASADDIAFTVGARFDAAAGSLDWSRGARVRWRFRLAGAPIYRGAETVDGRDENGNGLVDEGYVTRAEGSLPEVTLCADVLEQSMPVEESDGVAWITSQKVAGILDLSQPGSTTPTFLGPYEIQGFRFERGAAPRDDQVKVTVTTAGRLADRSVYARQLVETVFLRND